MKRILSILIVLLAVHASFGQCNPSFTASLVAPSGNYLLVYDFTNTTNFTPTYGYVPHYSMDYGDGSSGSAFSHEYWAAGTYTVVMTMDVTDSQGTTVYCTNTTSQIINANYTPCSTSLTYTITAQNSTEEIVSFIADNPANTSGMTFSWTFGDGGTGTGTNPSHSYTQNGYYNVTLTATGPGCSYTNTTTVFIGNIIDCSTVTSSISDNVNYYSVNFTDNHNTPSSYQDCSALWDFGDGSTTNYSSPFYLSTSHTYASASIYTVTLTTEWVDTGNNLNTVLCTQTVTGTVSVTTAPPPPSPVISGNIYFNNGPAMPDSINCKIWLITFDSATNLLEAIDSVTTTGYILPYFEFVNEPSNTYRLKAALIYNTPGISGYMPTYDTSDLYWSQALTINFYGSNSTGHIINMQYGTVPSGPGFIAGNVLSGANKTTGTTGGIPAVGMMIYLRDASNNILTYTYTDVNGNYTFSNIADGSYSIYPEAINYATTPFTGITVSGQTNNINFKQNTTALTIEPVTTGICNVTANTNVNIYPNPTTGSITISWQQATKQNARVTITDVIGREVYNTNLTMSAGNGSARLNLSQLQNGIYTVQLRSADLNYTQKLVIAGK